MALEALKQLDDAAGGTWSYDCLPRVGVCAIDGQPLTLCLRLGGRDGSWVQRPPDVLEVQAWFEELLRTPTTVEAVAIAAAKRWGMTARSSGFTATHGTITFQVPA